MLPKARQDKLTIRTLAEETLVYDLEQNKAHCLNRAAGFIWRHCDGQTPLPELAALVEEELGVEQGQAVVRLALEQLSRRNLLQEPVTPLSGAARHSRRDLLKKLAAAAAMPAVMTVTAKTARAAGGSTPIPPTPPITSCIGVSDFVPCTVAGMTGKCCKGVCSAPLAKGAPCTADCQCAHFFCNGKTPGPGTCA